MPERKVIIIVLLMVINSLNGLCQMTVEQFGKNRVQFKTFNWGYYSTENFDIYFYKGGEKLAKTAAEYLEEEFERITDMLGYAPYSKTGIFLYNSVTDLQQSNVGVNENTFSVGGQTDFIKSQVEIAYPGMMGEFKSELILKISQMLINDMMFGGSLSDMFQNSYLLALPEWFIDGAAHYIAYGWSVEMDDFIRDHFLYGEPKKLNKYIDKEAVMIGHSVWNFVAEKYGKSDISNILNLTRIIRNEEKSISNTLGISFKNFINEWDRYYTELSQHVMTRYQTPESENRIIKQKRKGLFFHKLKISPDGKYVAYSKNIRGKYKVRIRELNSKREQTVLSGGYEVINQEMDRDIPLISWIDDENLAIINTKFGKNFLWVYNLQSRKRVKKELTRLNQIKDFDVSSSGNLGVLSADINGQSDLFLISLRRNSIKRLTNDIFDDANPKFVPGSSAIVFSSNRITDSLTTKTKYQMDDVGNIYNLYIYNVDTTRNVLHKITNTLSKDYDPNPVSSSEIYYLSDQQGIANLYKYDLKKVLYTQISKFNSSIVDYDIAPNKEGFVYSMLNNKNVNIYYDRMYDLNDNTFTPQTRRQELINAKYVAERIRKRREKIRDSLTVTAVEEAQQQVDSELQNLEAESEQTLKEEAPEDLQDVAKQEDEQDNSEFIDTDNYVFDREPLQESEPKESFLSQYRMFKRKSEILGPYDYETMFSAKNLVTSFVIDPLMGFGIKIESSMNDLLEDHRFYGGVLATTDLRSGNFFGEYMYLKHTVDFSIRFDRKSLYVRTEQSSQKYYYNKFEFGAALPVSVTSRFAIKPFYAFTKYHDLNSLYLITPPPNANTSSTVNYGGFSAEFVYDNSVVSGLNMIEGTRGKITYTLHQGLNDPNKSFAKFDIDFRNYQKIHRELVFATRLFYGRSFGPNPQKYLLGGMDNWLFNKTDYSGRSNPLNIQSARDNSHLLFMEYVTSLRGFDYNTFYGTNALLFNAELRFPIVRYFHQGPISSNFFRNLLLIGFYDIGSSWTGKNPFATQNSVNTELINDPGSPFQAIIRNYKNPWLSSYGFGLRTVMLGYYMKLDFAYPVVDYKVKDLRFFFTLGYDF